MNNDMDDYYEKKTREGSQMAMYMAYAFLSFMVFAVLIGLYIVAFD